MNIYGYGIFVRCAKNVFGIAQLRLFFSSLNHVVMAACNVLIMMLVEIILISVLAVQFA